LSRRVRWFSVSRLLRNVTAFGCGAARAGEWHIHVTPDFKPGDPRPEGYLAWHEWARVQHRAGLRQRQCPVCLRWRFPQEKCCEVKRCD